MIREGTALTLRSIGGGPWRIRHHVPGGNGAAGCALFCVGHNAQLRVHAVDFEIVCIPTANPVKANLAVLPPLPEAAGAAGASAADRYSDDCAEEEIEEVKCLCQPQGNLPVVRRAIEPSGTLVELSGCTEARGYDSRLVVRGSWAFNGGPVRLDKPCRTATGWSWYAPPGEACRAEEVSHKLE